MKKLLCRFRNTHTHTAKVLKPDNLFVGVGSDEAIDVLLRCFCVPGRDKILTCPPTYGVYKVFAQANDIEIVQVPLMPAKGFAIQPEAINQALTSDPSIKLVYICTPGNPTGSLIPKSDIQQVLEHPTWNGVVVLDEAYIDFTADGTSLAEWVNEWPNLVVMQTLSKGFGLAGIRLGSAFTAPPIAALLNKIRGCYNISAPTSALAIAALQPQSLAVMQRNKDHLLAQRDRMVVELPRIPGVGRIIGGRDTNFLLVEIRDGPAGRPSSETAMAVYTALAERNGVVTRFRGKELGCEGCLRITVGTATEVDVILEKLRGVLADVFGGTVPGPAAEDEAEQEQEQRANDVIA